VTLDLMDCARLLAEVVALRMPEPPVPMEVDP
jgi:hypothetical protein